MFLKSSVAFTARGHRDCSPRLQPPTEDFMRNTSKVISCLLMVSSLLIVSCKTQESAKKSGGGLFGRGSGAGAGQESAPDPAAAAFAQGQSASIGQVKILNQKQMVETLISVLEIPSASRTAVMNDWDRLKGQLSQNGTGNELSASLLGASTQLVGRACSLVPRAGNGYPMTPVGTPSNMAVQELANFYSLRFLNRSLQQTESEEFLALISAAYSGNGSDAVKFNLLGDMICTVLGTSAEAQIL